MEQHLVDTLFAEWCMIGIVELVSQISLWWVDGIFIHLTVMAHGVFHGVVKTFPTPALQHTLDR
jgi:hypothetical protein